MQVLVDRRRRRLVWFGVQEETFLGHFILPRSLNLVLLRIRVSSQFLRIILLFVIAVAISSGRTILRYHAKSPERLSFGIDQAVQIFSKEAENTNDELWGVEVMTLVANLINTV